ncbi:AraC family transcriptional regulator ligand-binding domain-containing protein [Streptomyces sp. NRRL F-5123]|uniref:AraC family transcriptional regulator ligand-binding domain-containing protein n=1 Tax=Streptomyces sp. NRRL F-5123 TaxID=1463856 RepID=UPI000694511B|nr:AraC family transcriptional regulator ligand-binding domain-containing protein [Streptomyces sp. NRRL F-5123]
MPPTLTSPPTAVAAPNAGPTESVALPRLIARAAATGDSETRWLLRAAGLRPDVLDGPATARVPSMHLYRLWTQVVGHTGREDAGLLTAAEYRHGQFDLFDYLFSTAPTLGEGLAVAGTYLHLLSDGSALVTEESDDEVILSYGALLPDSELRGLVAEFVLGAFTQVIRHSTGGAVTPARVSFAHRAPRRTAGHTRLFGDGRIDFGAGADSITLTRRALDTPLPGADPALAAIIRRTAAAVPPHRPAGPLPDLRRAILTQFADGRPSLAEAARQLAVSPRTLQRRLAESDTTWRAELDAVREEFSVGLRRAGNWSAQQAAARLGYAEARSLRRARSRWDAREERTAEGGDGARTAEGTGGPTTAGGTQP